METTHEEILKKLDDYINYCNFHLLDLMNRVKLLEDRVSELDSKNTLLNKMMVSHKYEKGIHKQKVNIKWYFSRIRDKYKKKKAIKIDKKIMRLYDLYYKITGQYYGSGS